MCWDAVCFACFQELPLCGGLLGSAPARLRNAKETSATRMQKCEPAAQKKCRSERALAGREWRHLGPMTDQSFDCHIAAALVAGHLGRPPLLGFDSTEEAGWPGTGLWKKGKASLGLIQALQSLPLPVFVASALRNVDDSRRSTKSLLRRCACPEFFNQHLPLRNFCLCTSSLSFDKLLTPSPSINNLLVAFKSDYNSW